MFCIVKLNSNLQKGTVVKYDTANNNWTTASTHGDLVGVISEDPNQDEETLEWWAKVTFAGMAFALADRAISDQGGELEITNGKVFVNNAVDGCGIIAPIARGQATRNANDLVLVHIR